jgi:pyruvate,water dikinase
MEASRQAGYVLDFDDVGRGDVGVVGGKNASLGELQHLLAEAGAGAAAATGFATTVAAFNRFIETNALAPVIDAKLQALAAGRLSLSEAAGAARAAILAGQWPDDIAQTIRAGYERLCAAAGRPALDVAVRSSGTYEDLPGASFAGQHETYLNISGPEALLDACKRCLASLYTDRAVAYREAKGLAHVKAALSVGVQRMVRADLAGAGVMFSIDPESGFPNVVVINAGWGLGESVVQGAVDPDEYQVCKPLLQKSQAVPIVAKKLGEKARKLVYGQAPAENTVYETVSASDRARYVLSDSEIMTLARWAARIETHYGLPMDIEWAKDGLSGELFILQARPETVHAGRRATTFKTITLSGQGQALVRGLAIGGAAATGQVRRLRSPAEGGQFPTDAILVAETTDPDWVPIMKRAAAVVTDHGGRTSHAAIVSRELGVPAIVGAKDATTRLTDGQEVTVSCAEGLEGVVYAGRARVETEEIDLATLPKTRTKIMLNLANPAAAYRWWSLPADGVGLARMEFVVSNHIKAHPMALVRFEALEDAAAREAIAQLTQGYADKKDYFVDRLSRGLARIAAAFYPRPVIIRTSDFKTNEYARLLGGAAFEAAEENPMLGLRGASRYYSPRYREAFALECRALKRLREEMGFDNVIVMIPFCRSAREADRVLALMAENGLRRGEAGLEIYVMCEIPSNVILAKDFAERFDGFSIGSNDLTQLTLGVDRDCEDLAELFDEQDEAVKWMISEVITAAHKAEAKVGLCGQAPSDYPEFAEFLVDCDIDSISVSPDSFVAVKRVVAAAEERRSERWRKRRQAD